MPKRDTESDEESDEPSTTNMSEESEQAGASGSSTAPRRANQNTTASPRDIDASQAYTKCVMCRKAAQFRCSRCNTVNAVFYCSRDCQIQHWTDHRLVCTGGSVAPQSSATNNETRPQNRSRRIQAEGSEHVTEEERISDFRFYMEQIYVILKPVLLCILFSILWVKLANPPTPYYNTGATSPSSPVSVGDAFGSGGSGSDASSLQTALIIMAQIIGATIIIALLFKFGQVKLLYGFFFLFVTALLGLFGYILGLTLLEISNAPLDWMSFMFFLWNMVAVGTIVIFWRGPHILQQVYLILMSSMMAYTMSFLPSLVTWILLAFLAIWDLVAVLCPFGPLRIMLESARDQGQEIPSALVYTAMVYMMAVPKSSPLTVQTPSQRSQPASIETASRSPRSAAVIANGQPNTAHSAGEARPLIYHPPIEMGAMARNSGETSSRNTSPVRRAPDPEEQEEDEDEEDEDEEDEGGLKLGLGDFVFYSVLIGRASLFDWITTITTLVAVTTGLSMTIFLLTVLRKPLPALPISILFGILFYFVSSITLLPYIELLVILPSSAAVSSTATSGLMIGTSGGGGFLFH